MLKECLDSPWFLRVGIHSDSDLGPLSRLTKHNLARIRAQAQP